VANRRAERRAIAAIGLALLAWQCGATPPPLPNLSSAPSAIRTHLDVERESGIDGYCVALHADMFFAEAQRCYAILERRDPSSWKWTYFRVLMLDENGGGPAVVNALRTVTARAPEFGPAWLRLGEAEFKLGEYDEAVKAWSRAIAAREPDRGTDTPQRVVDVPLSAYARFNLARVKLTSGDPDGARRLLEDAIAAAPRFGSAYRMLSEADRMLNREAEASNAKSRADKLPPYAPYADPMIEVLARTSRNATFLLRQASEADLDSNAPWSEFLIRRALGFDPENPEVLAKLGRVLRTLGRNDEALEVLRAYHSKVPGDFQGLAQLGSCLTDLKQYAEAERDLRQALEGVDDAQTHYNLGVVLAATDRVKEGIEEYQRALQRDAYLSDARNNLAAAYARQGRMAEAAAELTKVLAADPDNALARANLQIIGRPDSQSPTSRRPERR
jgi:tetratricopeptide (TPR) repeat protein